MGIFLDISNKNSIKKGISSILKRFGKIDVLVNNAAIDAKFNKNINKINPTRFENYPLDLLKKSVDVNLLGSVMVTQIVVQKMLKKKKGNIINVTSTYALVAPDQRLYKKEGEKEQIYKPVDYIVTKSFIPGFSRYLATHLAPRIRVNCIITGWCR